MPPPDGPEQGEAEVITLDRRRGTAVVYKVGGREYPLRTHPNCRVCESTHREDIEQQLLKGYGYASVARHLPDGAGLTSENISNHVRNGHLPVELTVRRAIMEERAVQIGKSIEDAETAIIDHIGFARLGLQRVLERLEAGEIKPTLDHGIEFAKILLKADEIASDQGNLDQQVLFRGFLGYMQAIQSVCTPEQVREIGQRISSNPVIKGYLNRVEAEIIDVPAEEGNAGNDGRDHTG